MLLRAEIAQTLAADSDVEEELAHLENMDPEHFDRRKWVALSFARTFVSGKFGSVPRELRREMREHYTAREIKEIELVIRVMDLGNRGANTWDALLSRLKGEPAADSHIIDEAVLSGAFLAVAPIAIAYLAYGSKRSFLETARSLVALLPLGPRHPARFVDE